tara:strand:+ start:310 stop:564 length:255 start_codon:yes stop_codon:yes gene_type:complete
MKNKNKVVKTDPLDKLAKFSNIDMVKFQSAIHGYDLKKARKFQDKLKDLCFKNGLIDDKIETITDLLIRLMVNEKIQQLKGDKK